MGFRLSDDYRGNNDSNLERRRRRSSDDDEARKAANEMELHPFTSGKQHSTRFSTEPKKRLTSELRHSRAVANHDKFSPDVAWSQFKSSPAYRATSKIDLTGKTSKILLPPTVGDDSDDDCTRSQLFEPLRERSLEREIRTAREREADHRRARGLTRTPNDDAWRPVEVRHQGRRAKKSCGGHQPLSLSLPSLPLPYPSP